MNRLPIYTSRGDWVALLVDDIYLLNPDGEWIGWVSEEKYVFSVHGDYAGWLSKDNRILRHRDTTQLHQRRTPPPAPPRIRMPGNVPLPPMMAELRFDTVDVFEEAPHRLDPMDMDQVSDIE